MIDPKIAPALQQQAEELKKSQLEDALNTKLEQRPPASELIDHNILHGNRQRPSRPSFHTSMRSFLHYVMFLATVFFFCEYCANPLPDFFSSFLAYVFNDRIECGTSATEAGGGLEEVAVGG